MSLSMELLKAPGLRSPPTAPRPIERRKGNSHAREQVLLSLMLGLLNLVWVGTTFWHAAGLPSWVRVYQAYGISDEWLFGMLCIGFLQVFGCRCRNYRQIGLVLSMHLWMSIFGLYLLGGFYSAGMLIPLIFSVFSGLAYADEVYSKIKYAMGSKDEFFA